jgi:hypothetical protein
VQQRGGQSARAAVADGVAPQGKGGEAAFGQRGREQAAAELADAWRYAKERERERERERARSERTVACTSLY